VPSCPTFRILTTVYQNIPHLSIRDFSAESEGLVQPPFLPTCPWTSFGSNPAEPFGSNPDRCKSKNPSSFDKGFFCGERGIRSAASSAVLPLNLLRIEPHPRPSARMLPALNQKIPHPPLRHFSAESE